MDLFSHFSLFSLIFSITIGLLAFNLCVLIWDLFHLSPSGFNCLSLMSSCWILLFCTFSLSFSRTVPQWFPIFLFPLVFVHGHLNMGDIPAVLPYVWWYSGLKLGEAFGLLVIEFRLPKCEASTFSAILSLQFYTLDCLQWVSLYSRYCKILF